MQKMRGMLGANLLSCEAGGAFSTGEAGDSIKPGAQAPGSDHKNKPEPVKRATARRRSAVARFAGLNYFGFLILGLAPQALCRHLLRRLKPRPLPASQVTNSDNRISFDRYGLENAAKCVGQFGSTYSTPNGARANLKLGQYDYLIQQNWVLGRKEHCAMNSSL